MSLIANTPAESIRLILAYQPKTSDSYLVDMMYVEFMKNFLLPIPASWWLLDSFWQLWAQKTSDSYFVDMMYVEFMKNYLLADSTGVLAVKLILASWAQKQVIPTL